MPSYFPALKGNMGDLDYCIVVMHLGELVKQVKYAEEVQDWKAGIPSELKMQRKLNLSRVRNEMVPYLRDNPDHFFSALTVELQRPGEVNHEVKFRPFDGQQLVGEVIFDGTETLTALDGQHRLKAIELVLSEEPELAKEIISVIIVPHKGIERSQQLFSDLNRNAKQPSKTLNILFEHREFFARVAKALADRSKFFSDRTNMETNSLTQKSPHIVTLSVLYECTATLLLENECDEDKHRDESIVQRAADEIVHIYDDVIMPSLPDVIRVINGSITAHDMRTKYVFAHSVGMQAVARAVRVCIDQSGSERWETIVKDGFSQIDWRIKNHEWEGSAVQGGKVATRRQNIVRTACIIKLKLGLDVPQNEKDDLLSAIRAINPERDLPKSVV
jgi:DNA sulfur modification protein DndB